MTNVAACSPPPGVLSEGPRWDAARSRLLWVDILGKAVHRARVGPDGDLVDVETTAFEHHVGAVAPVAGGGMVVAAGAGFHLVDDGGQVHVLAQPEAGQGDVRMNDGACDPQGRFWAGTMAYDESAGAGALYRLDADGTSTRVLDGLTISNGIGWSPDGRTMYLNDSGPRTVDAFSFDGASGAIGDRHTIVTLDGETGSPDGLTVDSDGMLWVALYGGHAVRRYAPDGTLLATVELPVEQTTACWFGGHDFATLYVTTGRQGLDDDDIARQPLAGRVFRVAGLGVRGVAAEPYRRAP
jgi:sugar lactone lactonase YvrE